MKDYPGFATRPFTWSEIVAKLDEPRPTTRTKGVQGNRGGGALAGDHSREGPMNLLARVEGRPRQARRERARRADF